MACLRQDRCSLVVNHSQTLMSNTDTLDTSSLPKTEATASSAVYREGLVWVDWSLTQFAERRARTISGGRSA